MSEGYNHDEPLHILFFPFLASGHLIPIADMAALFAARGVRCTILTTPVQASIIGSIVDRANSNDDLSSQSVHVAVVPFPDVGLPPWVENGTSLSSQDDRDKFFHAATLLREPFDRFLADNRTDAVVADSFFHWSVDAAAERGVPRIAFLGSSMFARSCSDSMLRHNPLENAPDDPDAFVALPGLPHRVQLRRSQMMDPRKRPAMWAFHKDNDAADQRSFGEVFNSFHELEPDYVEHYHRTLGRRAWLVGPVALASKDMAGRGTDALSPDASSCLRWLDTKHAGSVVYVSFGTLSSFSPAELRELARGLDLSGKDFVWIISSGTGTDGSEWMPEGFAELMARGDCGIIIRDWAPQTLILNHPALGGFMTQCGWNSALESVAAGVPMVCWPFFAEQQTNCRFKCTEWGIGMEIGEEVTRTEVEAILREAMDGEKGRDMRRRAVELQESAVASARHDGRSMRNVDRLIHEVLLT